MLSTSSRGRSPAPISSSVCSTERRMISACCLGRGCVEHVREQVGAARLLERRAERVDELVGKLADEADGVGQQVRAAAEAQLARGRVERVEQPVADPDLGAGQRVQQRRLAGVRVADERDRRQRRALALGALHGARALDVLEAPAQRGDPVAREAAVGLDLRLPGPPRADPAAEPLEVAPQPAHAREVVFQLGQLDLQLALGAAGVRGEDVEDHGRAIDDGQADGLLEVALLARGQLVVAGDQVRVAGVRGGLGLGDLARARGRCSGAAARAAGPSRRRPPRRRCAAARRARRGRRPPAAPRRRRRAGAHAARLRRLAVGRHRADVTRPLRLSASRSV